MQIHDVIPNAFFFKDDGVIPNSSFPVLVYSSAFTLALSETGDTLIKVFQSNNWTNNWKDIILTEDHYHSTSHEVLGIVQGGLTVHLGGPGGMEIDVSAGDVIVIPAGVAHCSKNGNRNYLVIGGYPNGLEWDMIYAAPHKYALAKRNIQQLDIPKTDPLYGEAGFVHKIWGQNQGSDLLKGN